MTTIGNYLLVFTITEFYLCFDGQQQGQAVAGCYAVTAPTLPPPTTN